METERNNPLLVDAHQDLAYNALAYGRDYRRSALETRALEKQAPVPTITGRCTLGLPELLQGRIALVAATLFVMPARRHVSNHDVVYTDVEQAHRHAMSQLDLYHRWAEEEEQFALVGSKADLEAVLATWEREDLAEGDAADAEPEIEVSPEGGAESYADARQVGILPLMENADPIREPAELELWFERGVRIVGPAWHGTRYSGGTGEPGPLTDLGRELLEVMADLGMALDLSHMADEALVEALDRFEGVLLASHSNPRAIVPSDRHLSDAAILGIAEREGVIGIVPCNSFLQRGWRKGDRKERVTLVDVVRAIDYVCQRVGDAQHVGLGSDFDGGFGADEVPAEIDTIADLHKIGGALAEHGYEPPHIAAILGGNWLRLFRRLLPE